MSLNKPFFSIVMPTRERAHLLEFALQSAVSQTFDDYEILVSDNHSTDHTREVVRNLADKRVRYVRTEKRLSMPDSWEFAFEHAQGEYVTYLSDDDALRPSLLEKLYPIVTSAPNTSIGWRYSGYYHPDWPNKRERCRLFPPPTLGDIQEIPSSLILEKMFALDYSVHFPRLLNSCCARSFLEERKRRMGKLFVPIAPDYSIAIAILTGMDRIHFIDEPLIVCGLASASNGSYGYGDSNALRTFMSEFSDLERIWRIPLSAPTAYNQIAVTIIGLKEILAGELASYSLSIDKLFIRGYQEAKFMEARGADVRQILEDWSEALADQSAEVQRSVRNAISSQSEALLGQSAEVQWSAREDISPQVAPRSTIHRLKAITRERFPIAARAASSIRRAMTGQSISTGQSVTKQEPAQEQHFDNILEAVKALENACQNQ